MTGKSKYNHNVNNGQIFIEKYLAKFRYLTGKFRAFKEMF